MVPPDSPKKRNTLAFVKVFNSTIVLAGLTSLLYLHGSQYNAGYLNAFGIDGSMFQHTVDRILIDGFSSVFHQAVKASGTAMKIVAASIVAGVLLLLVGKIPWVKTKVVPLIWTNEKQKETVWDRLFTYSMYLFLLLVVFLFIFIPVGFSYQYGSERGKGSRNEYDKNLDAKVLSDSRVLTIEYETKEKTIVSRGYVVETSENMFAFYRHGKTLILPREKLHFLETAVKLP